MNTQSPARLAGSASIAFQTPVYISSCASGVGKKEGEGPLGDKFDLICEDPMFGCDTWEAAESTMQKEAATLSEHVTHVRECLAALAHPSITPATPTPPLPAALLLPLLFGLHLLPA